MFQLIEPTLVTITNANPRRELHGEDKVRAIDIAFTLTGENTMLDWLEPGLREHHYCNKAAKAGQDELPGVDIPLPNIRHPQLPLSYNYAKGQKWRGYRFIWNWGIEGDHVDFTDAVLSGLQYELGMRCIGRFCLERDNTMTQFLIEHLNPTPPLSGVCFCGLHDERPHFV